MTDIESDSGGRTYEDLSEPVTIGVEAYISEDYARAERDKLWRKVWQQVGRVEEIPEVGNYLTYDILDDSIIVVRTGPKRIHGLPQRLHASRPPAGRHPRRRQERLRPGAQVVRLRLPRLDLRPRTARTPTSATRTTGRAR